MIRHTILAAALLLLALGLTMMAAWLARAQPLAAAFPGLFQMKFNTAAGFVAAGIGLFAAARRRRALGAAAAGLVLSLGAATLLEYAARISLGIDQLWVRDFYEPGVPYPGRMAPNTSLAFLLAAATLLMATYLPGKVRLRTPAMELIGFLVFSIGALGVVGRLRAVTLAYNWGSYTAMALPTAAGFMILGSGLVALAWQSQGTRVARAPLWVPSILCFLVLLLDIGTPRGVAGGIAYIPLLFCSLWFTRRNTVFVFASIASLLSTAGFLVKAVSVVPTWMVMTNRALTLGALWFMAALVYLRRGTEEALRASEQRYELVARGMSIGVWDWDLVTNEQYWSPRMREIVGITDENFQPRYSPDDNRIHPEDRQRVIDMLQTHIARQGPYDTEFRVCRQDGSYAWVHATGQAIWDETGRPLRMVGSMDDITESKRIQVLLRAVVDYAVDGLITIDARGTVESFNPACERLFGYTAAEVIGRNIKMLMPDPYYDRHDGYLAHYLATGEARIIGTSGREVSGKRKDGSVFPMDLSVNAFQLGDGRHFSGIVRDITGQKKSAHALEETNNRFRLLVEGVKTHALFTMDTEGRITSWNRGAERLLGFTESEIVGRGFSCIFTPEDIRLGLPAALLEKARASGQVEEEGWRVRANGELFCAAVNGTALLGDDGALRGFAVVLQDVTERKKIAMAMEEARLEKLRFREGFLSHVSHELRTPLTAIYFFTTNVLDGLFGELTEDQREHLKLSLENANQLKNMVSDLLDITRIETRKLTVAPQPTNLYRLIGEVISTCRTNAVGRNIDLRSDCPEDLPSVWADPSRVRQILTNLIDNGIKFTPDGGSVTVSSRPHDAEDGFLRVSVSDTGCGISPESRELIFERLAQIKSNTEASRSGLGLGLFIARELVSLHGGRIWVDSVLGQGSTFHLTLPIFSLARWCSRILIAPNLETGCVTLIAVDIVSHNGALKSEFLHEIRKDLERCIQPGQDVLLPSMGGRPGEARQVETIFIVACTGPSGFAVIQNRIRRELQGAVNLSEFRPIISSTTVPVTPGLSHEEQIAEITAGIEQSVQQHLLAKEKVQ